MQRRIVELGAGLRHYMPLGTHYFQRRSSITNTPKVTLNIFIFYIIFRL